jgi:pimeloyl-ACP methyl ester carboxylesterase
VVVPDLRGHGGSGGRTTLGDLEALDVEAAVRAAAPGLPAVTVGMSMGAAAVLRHAALFGGVAGTVAISPPGWWAPRDRPGTARVERLVTSPAGRQLARRLLRTRIGVCDPRTPILELVDRIAPAFTIVVQDPADSYFAPEHGRALYERANDPKALWTVPGAGHGSDILTPAFAARLLDDLCARSGSI